LLVVRVSSNLVVGAGRPAGRPIIPSIIPDHSFHYSGQTPLARNLPASPA